MTNTIPAQTMGYYQQHKTIQAYEDDLKPYASLFLKPLTNKKCAFSKPELDAMCKDPLHSPRMILYLINFFKHM